MGISQSTAIEYRNALLEYQAYTNKYNEYVKKMKQISDQRWGDKINQLCEKRNFSRELVDELQIFYVDTMAEMLLPEFMPDMKMFGLISPSNGRPIFSGRYCIPIKDSLGNVINIVGYSWEHDERYLYGTGEYYDRANTLYGLESLDEAYRLGWGVLVEGITDRIALLDLGIKNCFAMCGTRESEHKMRLLNHCKYGMVFIKDRDKAGDQAAEKWEVSRYIRLNISSRCKDIDEFLNKCEVEQREEVRQIFMERLGACVQWLVEREHKGAKYESMETTILA